MKIACSSTASAGGKADREGTAQHRAVRLAVVN